MALTKAEALRRGKDKKDVKDPKKVKKDKKTKEKAPKKEKVSKGSKAESKKSGDGARAKKRSPPAPEAVEQSKKPKKSEKKSKESKKPKAEKKPATSEAKKKDKQETQLALVEVDKKKSEEPKPSPPPRRVSIKSKPIEITPESSPCSIAARVGTPCLKKALFPSDASNSGITSPAVSLSSLQAWKEEANNRGLSLEEYMEDVSRNELEKNLTSHMHQLVKESSEKEDDEDKSPGNEASSESDDEMEESEDEDEEDEDEDQKSEGPKEDTKENEEDTEKGAEENEEESEDGSASSDSQEESEEEDDEIDPDELEGEIDKIVHGGDDKQEGEKEAEEKTAEKAKACTNNDKLASAVAEQAVSKPDYSQANSTTHKAQWDKFARQCLDRKKFPISLASHFIKDKTDLFREWVEVSFKRRAEHVTTHRRQREGVKARDLLTKYPKEKAESLLKSLRSRGLWAYDTDFPKDEEEIWYYANQGNKIRADDITAESTSVQIQEKGNQELAEALIGEGGVMQAGFQPEFETATDEGSKQLVEAMNNAESKAAKPKKGNKNKEENQKAEPQTLPEPMIAQSKMDECLKKGADGRKLSIQLNQLEYSGDLPQQMLLFSSKMEKVYALVQDLCKRKVDDEKQYKRHFTLIDEKLSWFEQAEAAANALLKGLKAKKPKKNKKDKKDKDQDAEKPAPDK